MASDLKQVQMAKQESERKRKQQDTQLSEMTIKLAELERSKGDASDRLSKLQVCSGLGLIFFFSLFET